MNNIKINFSSLLVVLLSATFVSCGGDDSNDGPQPTGNSKTYVLGALDDSGISGTAVFEEYDDNSVNVVLSLNGTSSASSHPAHIHFNTVAEGGDIAVTLGTVDGSGVGTITLTELDDGTPVTYDELIEFDGYINVHQSSDDSSVIAQGDIGQNELTGASISYDLSEKDVAGISGNVVFSERANGEALAVISLNGTSQGDSHPAHIHMNSAAEGGDIVFTFNAVDGATGVSRTNVAQLDDASAFGYEDVTDYDGYVNVHQSEQDLTTIVAQGDIGSNATGDETSATINYDVTNSGASAYVFNGDGLSDAQNPSLTLQRGKTYTFTVNASGHPFWINSSQGPGTGNAYNSGVTNNGSQSGTITFTVPSDAPGTLFYNCQFHSVMTGTITITD